MRVVSVVREAASSLLAEVIRSRAERPVDSADMMMGRELHFWSR